MDSARDREHWAPNVDRLKEDGGVNVGGRRLTGPQQGFGQMWQKTYRVHIDGQSPEQVIAVWKAQYGRFWPTTNRFNAPLAGIQPGEVGLISGQAGPTRLSTGVMVLFADERSFTFMTPEGHPFAGWVTFSAHEEDGHTVAQVQALIRPNDPIYEVGWMVYGNRAEDRMWEHTLRSLAAHLGSSAEPATEAIKVDRRRLWHNAGNLRKNAAIGSVGHALARPFRSKR
jgi:hypothetical protein